MTEEEDAGYAVRGHVKWFDPIKGFGFVVADEGGPDILLHANVLRNFGQGTVADGTGIDVRVQKSARGVQAVEVISIDAPQVANIPLGEAAEILGDRDLNSIDLEPARVKWFDKSKGFGFANVFGRTEDVFVHIEVVRHSGFADLQPGEAVAMRIVDGQRGRMAVQINSWETGAKK
jgi:CspA family cold shock protein